MSFDTYTYKNGKSLRLLKKILVQGHDISEVTEGGIIKPGHATEHVWRIGTILAFGYQRNDKTGERTPIPDIEVGLHCVFIRYLAEQDSNKQMRDIFDDTDIFAIAASDILFVWPPNMTSPKIG